MSPIPKKLRIKPSCPINTQGLFLPMDKMVYLSIKGAATILKLHGIPITATKLAISIGVFPLIANQAGMAKKSGTPNNPNQLVGLCARRPREFTRPCEAHDFRGHDFLAFGAPGRNCVV